MDIEITFEYLQEITNAFGKFLYYFIHYSIRHLNITKKFKIKLYKYDNATLLNLLRNIELSYDKDDEIMKIKIIDNNFYFFTSYNNFSSKLIIPIYVLEMLNYNVKERLLIKEKEKIEREKIEKEKIEREKIEKEKIEREKIEREKIEKEKIERDKIKKVIIPLASPNKGFIDSVKQHKNIDNTKDVYDRRDGYDRRDDPGRTDINGCFESGIYKIINGIKTFVPGRYEFSYYLKDKIFQPGIYIRNRFIHGYFNEDNILVTTDNHGKKFFYNPQVNERINLNDKHQNNRYYDNKKRSNEFDDDVNYYKKKNLEIYK